jgi:hypothetical protein
MTRLRVFGALTLIGMAATIVVQGGWEAGAAAFAIAGGVGFALTFAALQAVGERPRSRRPAWAHETAPEPRRAAVTAPATSRQPATSGRSRPAPGPPRTAWSG